MPKKQSLAGRRGNLFWVRPEDLTLVRDPAHFLYDRDRVDGPLDPQFVSSVDAHGVRVPLFVSKRAYCGAQQTLVVAGRRRLRAALLSNDARKSDGRPPLEVPCISVACGNGAPAPDAALLALMIIENEAREEDTPAGKAEKTRRFVDLYAANAKVGRKATEDDLARVRAEAEGQAALAFGVTTKTVRARLRFLELAPKVKEAVAEGKINWWAATELASLQPDAQEARVVELAAEAEETGKKPTVEAAKRKAGKGDSGHRAEVGEARRALLEAAEAYGLARTSSADGARAKARAEEAALAAAALEYYRVRREAPEEAEACPT